MPELPEVETIVRGLRREVLGRTVQSTTVFKPLVVKEPVAAFSSQLTDKKIASIDRHGKSIFISFDGGLILKVHLGMTGQMLFQSKNQPLDPYVRVLFRLSTGTHDLVYRDVRQFGRLKFVSEPREKTWGPDAWDAGVDRVAAALQKKTGMVKHALLNQLVIAGVGNIYADESLHLSRIHPKRKLETLNRSDIDRLASAVRAVLKRSLDLGGTSFRNYTDTAGGRGGMKQKLRVYGRDGKECRECGTLILKMVVASRGTHYCPGCQQMGKRRAGKGTGKREFLSKK